MKRLLRSCLCLLACVPMFCAALSSPTLQLNGDHSSVNLSTYLDITRDPQRNLSIKQATVADYQPVGRAFSLGFTRDAVWLKFSVQREHNSPNEWWLEIKQPLMEDIRLYEQGSDGAFVERQGGESYPQESRDVEYRNVIFKLRVPDDGAQIYYLRLTSQKSMSAGFMLWRPHAFARAMVRETIVNSLFYGVICAIFLLYLLFWFYTRQTSSRYYLLYVALLAFISALDMGYLQAYVLPWRSGLTAMLLGTAICLAFAVGASFASHVFDFRRAMPRLNRTYLFIVWSVAFISALLVLSGYYAVGIPVIQMATLGSIAVLTLVPIYLGLRGQRSAWFYLLAFGIFNASVIVRFLRNLGIVPSAYWAEFSMQIGTLLHLIVMSVALAWEYRRLGRQKDAAQAAVLQTQLALEQERLSSEQQREFMSMVSHEFRTPLAIIDATTHMLSNNIGAENERPTRYAKIGRAVDRLKSLLNNYLSGERLAVAGQEAHFRPCRLNELLRNVVGDVMATPGPRLELSTSNLPDSYHCDPELLRILLDNLLENARRHSAIDQAVFLRVVGHTDGSLGIEVCDQGVGIPPDELPHLFERYFRGRAAQGKPGAGLGLFLVKRIAQRHGGNVTVDSTLGQGTRFNVQLPARRL